MVKISIDCYEVKITLLIRKDYWAECGERMSKKVLEEKLQQGIETPIDKFEIEINE